MFAEYPLLNLMIPGYFLLVMVAAFAVMGWCDPREYHKKIPLDIFAGVMTLVAFIMTGRFITVVKATSNPNDKLLDSVINIGQGLYNNIGFGKLLESVSNDLLGLILTGVSIMFVAVLYIVAITMAVYFPFRMFALLDVYLENMYRYILLGLAMIGTLVFGLSIHNHRYFWIAFVFGIVSTAKLVFGNIRLRNEQRAQKRKKKMELVEKSIPGSHPPASYEKDDYIPGYFPRPSSQQPRPAMPSRKKPGAVATLSRMMRSLTSSSKPAKKRPPDEWE